MESLQLSNKNPRVDINDMKKKDGKQNQKNTPIIVALDIHHIHISKLRSVSCVLSSKKNLPKVYRTKW